MKRWVLYAPYVVIGSLLVIVGLSMWKIYDIARDNSAYGYSHMHKRYRNKYTSEIVQPVTFFAQYGQDTNKMIARKGIIFRKDGARATVMICHGFMCNKTDIRFFRMLFSDYNVMIFDFRAHGESSRGQQCTFGHDEVHDIIAAARFVKADPELKKIPLIVYGFSMGAVSSINAQSRDGSLFDCAIWDCPFDSTDDLLERGIANLKISIGNYTFGLPGRDLLKRYAYNYYVQKLLKFLLKYGANMDGTQIDTCIIPIDTVKMVEKVTIPAFFITCSKDDKAPPYAVKKLYDATKGHTRFWETNGRHHFDSFFYNPEKYTYKVRRFIEKYLDGSLQKEELKKMYRDHPELEI